MSCGCGGECCGQKGLGFLSWFPESGGEESWDWGGDWWSGGDYGGGGYFGSDPYAEFTADEYEYLCQQGIISNCYGGYDPSATVDWNSTTGFLPTGQSGGDSNWQGLLDFWNDLVNGVTGNQGGNDTNSPAPILPYCPGGTYHPINNPYACVPFPPETPEFERQQRAAAAHKAAQDALKAAAAKAQQQQGCPPNTGLVKNAQGQCVCPPGYAPNAQLKKCVLVNASLAQSANGLPSDWWKYALLALGVIAVVKR